MASIIKELHAVAPPPKPPHGKEHLRWGPGTFGADDNANQFQAWKSAILADAISSTMHNSTSRTKIS
eukprot:m.306801 g.306801  ORF g.306801 m.306801 type:complete len:67 (-) comp20191_c1_seq58:897-1097(-)